MGIRELRQHIRFRTKDKAQLRLAGGICVPCSIHDISMGGAYLVQEQGTTRHVPLSVGDKVRVRIIDLGAGNRYTLSADIVRLEPNGGPGVAIRFRLTEDTTRPITDHLLGAAQREGLPARGLQVVALKTGRKRWGTLRRVTDTVVRVSLLAAFAGMVVIGATWLDSTIL
ncbi:MAG: PilZ domain-containing protein [Myxococcota bacterium]|nr:PilZ domain-containing protein [Myxococcota bacterium]